MIIWVVGQSAAGKTTIGRSLLELWKKRDPNTVFVDGDEIRKIFKLNEYDDPYSVENRKNIAETYHRICAWLDSQKINVICCTISNFQEVLDANKSTFSNYFEVFVQVPFRLLQKRDKNNLYKSALKGDITNVVGVDIPFVPPANPDLVIDNSPDITEFGSMVTDILEKADAKSSSHIK